MFSKSVFGIWNLWFIIFITPLWFTDLIDAKSEFGSKYACEVQNYPYFSLIFKQGAVCGGALLTETWVVLAKDCLKRSLGEHTQKWVRIGVPPHCQFRRVATTVVCDKECDVAVVEATRNFILNQYVNVVKGPMLKGCDEQPFYLFMTYEKPWRRNRPLQMYCAHIKVKLCQDNDTISTTLQPPTVPSTRPSTPSKHNQDYDSTTEFEPPPPTKRPDEGIEMICGSHDNRMEDYEGYYSNEDGLAEVDPYDEPKPEDQFGVCSDNTGGPLICRNRLFGFLMGYTCEIPGSNLLGFSNAFVNLRELKKLTGDADIRKLRRMTPWPMDFTVAGGRSLHKRDGFQTKFLSVVMTILLYIFFY